MKRQKYKNHRRKSDPKSVVYEKVEIDSRWQPEDDLKLKTAIEQVTNEIEILNSVTLWK